MNMPIPALLYTIVLALALSGVASSAPLPRQAAVTGGPAGPHPYLFKSVSAKKLVENGRGRQWSITFGGHDVTDSIRILALRVEFNKGTRDTSALTTGNGLFGIRDGGDRNEYNRYILSDTVYRYDRLPHDSLYFVRQLEALSSYYARVSRGKLAISSTVYPAGSGQTGYAVPEPMTFYSPGGKKKKETWDEYYTRKTHGMLLFVRDALRAAASDSLASPFSTLRFNSADSTLRDENNHKTVILLFHAGSSYLTDGGSDGSLGRDSPSDMIDAFIERTWFKAFRDSLGLSTIGVPVKGADSTIILDEVMMCSETSNQDGLNWGIQGILVNQMARQLGIPDLFSTSSGVSAIGAFCIMDFAGYSAGNGFIPPYPSAWVRAFMGWDKVKIASEAGKSYGVTALSSVLGGETPDQSFSDTTILLVPLNDHEYYLIENRQRNLSGNDSLFSWDSTHLGRRVISPYPYNVNLDSNVVETSGASSVILRVKNNDVCLPASGVLVWHVDEKVLHDRLAYNLVNADSLYRGIALVEADGVADLGITFQDVFYQAAFDYGGAEDVFPHRTEKPDSAPTLVSGLGPDTRPSTTANDGGKTYLSIDITPSSASPRTEKSAIRDYTVDNFVDSVFRVTLSWKFHAPGWPKFAAPERFHAPLLVDLDPAHPGPEHFLLGLSGRLYGWSTDSASVTYGTKRAAIDRFTMLGDTVKGADTAVLIDSIGDVVAMPSSVAGKVFIPTTGGIRVLKGISLSDSEWDLLDLGREPTSYACRYRGDSAWAIGAAGTVVFGSGLDTSGSVKLAGNEPVCALAALRDQPSTVAAIQISGMLSLCSEGKTLPDTAVQVPHGIAPYTLVTGDLDRDGAAEIVVCDSRHGLWVYKQDLSLAPGWEEEPNDWPSIYVDTSKRATTPADRSRLPVNTSAPALADLNRDGHLDIVTGGTNGLYAFNYKGALISGWPSYLDNRFWYQRGSVLASPIVLTGTDREPLVVFSSPTGERPTFYITKIVKAEKERGTVWFMNEKDRPDSLWGLSVPLIDTLLTLNDSLVAPYTVPGGFVDAVKANGKRPLISGSLQSHWPLTTGSAMTTAPLAGITDAAAAPDLFAVSESGWVYRWRLPGDIMPDSLFWPQVGFDGGRSFAYGGGELPIVTVDQEPLTFFSYPNPSSGLRTVTFKYKFSSPATKVRLDVFTFSGFSVFSSSTMGAPPSHLTGSSPGWNELRVPVDRLAPGLYRCRMEATVSGKKVARFWKLAITR